MERKRVITIFSIASFLHDVGSDMVFSVWPLFVTQVLGANMAILGLIDGIGDAIVSISQAVSGYWADRLRKRKVFVWLGYFFGGISRLGYAFSTSWQMLIPFRALDRSGKIRGAPRDAIVSDVSDKSNRGKHFGILQAMDNAGAVIGILITIFLLGKLGYQTLFILAAIPSMIAVLLVFFFIKEKKVVSAHLFKGMSLRDVDRNLWLYIILSAIFSLGSFSYSFLLIFARQSGVQITHVPIFYLIFTLVAALVSLPFGKLSDMIGRKNVLFLSFTLWGIVLLTLLSSNKFIWLIAAFVVYGLHKGAIDPVQKSFTAELAPKQFVASTLGAFQMIIGIASLPASLLAGVLWDRFGMQLPLLVSLAFTVLASTLLLFVREKE